MKSIDAITIMLFIVLAVLVYMLFQNADEEIFYFRSPERHAAGTPMGNTSVPLLEGNVRWGKDTLDVYIDLDTSRTVPEFQDKFVYKFMEAADILSDSLGGRIKFNFVTQPADINVKWIAVLRAESLDAIGHTELNFTVSSSFRIIRHAEIELLPSNDGRALSEEQTLILSLHELGHALGLGHSSDKTSMMYPEAQSGLQRPSEMDIQSILDDYKLEPLPDFYVKDAQFSKRIVSRFLIKNYLFDGTVTIINDGIADSGDFSFSIETDNIKIEKTGKNIGPGESMILTLQNISVGKDFSEIVINIDEENTIKELNDDNEYVVDI